MIRISIDPLGHRCRTETAHAYYGPSVVEVVEDDEGHLFAVSKNREYASQVAFCPICGHKAHVPPEPPKPEVL